TSEAGNMSSELTVSEEQEVARLYDKGISPSEIAEKYGIRPATVRLIAHQYPDIFRPRERWNRHYHNINFFSPPLSKAAAYYLVLLAGDGCVSDSNDEARAPAVALSSMHYDFLGVCRAAIECTNRIDKRVNLNSTVYSVSIRGQQWAQDLAYYNLKPRKTLTL